MLFYKSWAKHACINVVGEVQSYMKNHSIGIKTIIHMWKRKKRKINIFLSYIACCEKWVFSARFRSSSIALSKIILTRDFVYCLKFRKLNLWY